MGTGAAAMAGNPRQPLPLRAWRHISPTCGSRSPTSRSRSGEGLLDHHDRRRRVPRLHRRNRGCVDGALPSEGDGGDRGTGGSLHPRTSELLPPRSARSARRAPRRDHAREHRDVLLRELRCGDHRSRGEAREAGDRTPARDRVLGQLPRPYPPHHGDDDVEDGIPRRVRAASGRDLRRAVPRPARRRRRPGDRPRARRLRPSARVADRAVGNGGAHHRTRAGRRRIHPGTGAFPAGPRRPVRAARHPLRRRRGPDRLRPHGRDVRGDARRHRAGRVVHGEGHRVGLPVLGAGRTRRDHGPVAEGQPRRDVRRRIRSAAPPRSRRST